MLIALTRGLSAMVDDDDFALVSQWKWYAHRGGDGFYAARRLGHKQPLVLMHRLINATPDGLFTDHIDGNGLNNQRANLRTATPRQNSANKRPQVGGASALKGAWFDRNGHNKNKWRSSIRVAGKVTYLGRFATEAEAAAAYDAASHRFFGDFARPNHGENA